MTSSGFSEGAESSTSQCRTSGATAGESPPVRSLPREAAGGRRWSISQAVTPSTSQTSSRGRGMVRGTAARASITDDEVEEGPPGTLHPTHQPKQIDAYTFCAVCGVYGKQLRRSALRKCCVSRPSNRFARLARDKLMSGMVPHGRSWQQGEGSVMPFGED